jgi:uncharacterized protein YndB with AHSA1/START domain
MAAKTEPNKENAMSAATRSRFVYVTFIRTTPEKLWEALTDPQFIRQYWFDDRRVRLEEGLAVEDGPPGRKPD